MTTPSPSAVSFTLTPYDANALASLCGQLNQHLKLIETRLGVEINNRSNAFQVSGDEALLTPISELLQQLYSEALEGYEISPESIHLHLQQSGVEHRKEQAAADKNGTKDEFSGEVAIRTRKALIRPRGPNQQKYVRSVWAHDINFGIGPAGTGKTYLAVACAVEALEQEQIERILLVRPAVEAGEKLGFLPGDLSQKVDPYLRPLYDALYEMIGFEKVTKLIEKNVIEIAPLAYMRGRTLNNAFVILDESQNTTREQMKMFLTRIGFGSTAVITGDVTQVDLPKGSSSGLKHAMEVLGGVKGIGFTHFTSKDVVRHPLVQHIVEAYDRFEKRAEKRAQDEKKES
jgi:phosphate starvation-inducible PhoH-like protein